MNAWLWLRLYFVSVIYFRVHLYNVIGRFLLYNKKNQQVEVSKKIKKLSKQNS